jgi:hypothetical protein
MTVRVEQQSLWDAAENVSAGGVEAPATEDDEVGADRVRDVGDLGRRLALEKMFGDHESEVAAERCRPCQRLCARLALGVGLPGQRLGTGWTDRRSDHEILNDCDRVQFGTDCDSEPRCALDNSVSGRGMMGGDEDRRLHGTILAYSSTAPERHCAPILAERTSGV